MVKFKDFECFSNTFQGKFNFQGLFKTVLYIQVLFDPVHRWTLSTHLDFLKVGWSIIYKEQKGKRCIAIFHFCDKVLDNKYLLKL